MSWIEDGCKEKPGYRSSEALIHHYYQETQFINGIGVEEAPSPSRPKLNDEEKAVIETPKKLEALRMKSVTGYTNFQQIAR
jgi:hypothetical protein